MEAPQEAACTWSTSPGSITDRKVDSTGFFFAENVKHGPYVKKMLPTAGVKYEASSAQISAEHLDGLISASRDSAQVTGLQ